MALGLGEQTNRRKTMKKTKKRKVNKNSNRKQAKKKPEECELLGSLINGFFNFKQVITEKALMINFMGAFFLLVILILLYNYPQKTKRMNVRVDIKAELLR